MNLIFKCVHDVAQIQTMFSSRYSPPRPHFNIRATITCSAYFSLAHWRGGSAKKGERPALVHNVQFDIFKFFHLIQYSKLGLRKVATTVQ